MWSSESWTSAKALSQLGAVFIAAKEYYAVPSSPKQPPKQPNMHSILFIACLDFGPSTVQLQAADMYGARYAAKNLVAQTDFQVILLSQLILLYYIVSIGQFVIVLIITLLNSDV